MEQWLPSGCHLLPHPDPRLRQSLHPDNRPEDPDNQIIIIRFNVSDHLPGQNETLTFRFGDVSLLGGDELELEEVICVFLAFAEFLFTFVFFTFSMDEYAVMAVRG